MPSSRRFPPQQHVFAAAADFAPDAGHKPPGAPRAVNVLKRGDIHFPVRSASPGTLSCLAELQSRFTLDQSADESCRRVCLARWITDPRNPLTWRSIVNRAWQHHFGRGLVSTPNDFGRMGALPSHPELLDYLATTFLESGGSLKQLDRLILSSAAFRQSTATEPSFAARDADNQWLWRQNRRRLDAEAIHDAILKLAGRLDTTMGGPSIQQFTLSPGVHVTPVVDYTQYNWDSPGSRRRSVYRFVFRTLPDPFYDALDSADPSQLTARAQRVDHPLAGARALEQPVRPAPVRALCVPPAPAFCKTQRPDSLRLSGRLWTPSWLGRTLPPRRVCCPARPLELLPRDHQQQ